MTTKRLLLTGLLLLPGCGTHSAIEESRRYTRLGDHQRAFLVLDEARQAEVEAGREPEAELQAAHDRAQIASLLQRARQRIFEE